MYYTTILSIFIYMHQNILSELYTTRKVYTNMYYTICYISNWLHHTVIQWYIVALWLFGSGTIWVQWLRRAPGAAADVFTQDYDIPVPDITDGLTLGNCVKGQEPFGPLGHALVRPWAWLKLGLANGVA